jgi:hypothetical protein
MPQRKSRQRRRQLAAPRDKDQRNTRPRRDRGRLPVFRNDVIATVAAENPDRGRRRERRKVAQMRHLCRAFVAATARNNFIRRCHGQHGRSEHPQGSRRRRSFHHAPRPATPCGQYGSPGSFTVAPYSCSSAITRRLKTGLRASSATSTRNSEPASRA